MEINWLKRTGSREIVLFFNGWGMDQRAVSHVEGEMDVCEVHDYRDIERGIAPDLDAYEAQEAYTMEYVAPLKAIQKNRSVGASPYNPMMFEREARVLELLMSEGYF